MSRLDSLLNPEQADERAWRQYNTTPPTLPGPNSLAGPSTGYQLYAAPAYAYDPSHHPHAGCPNSLRCLWDTNERPLNMPEALVQCAILGSPERRLTEDGILDALQSKYPYYRLAHAALELQNAVRTVLVQMPFFTRVPPASPSAGGGVVADSEDEYWTVDLSAVAYGRSSYASHLRSFSSETEYLTRESGNRSAPIGSLSAQSSINRLASVPVVNVGAPHIAAGSLAYISPHADHPGCPDSLTCLQDTDERPGYTLRTIITCTILGSPEQRLTLRDIFLYVKAKYPFFKVQNKTFEQSTRHMMSMDNTFQRQPRKSNEPGFGSFWIVDLNAQPGTKRPRWRAPRIPIPPEEQVKQGRGRPRMYMPLPKSQGGKVPKPRERAGASTLSAAAGAPGREVGIADGSATYSAHSSFPPGFDPSASNDADAAANVDDSEDEGSTTGLSYPEGYFSKMVNRDGIHELHENCPSSLRCLDDTNERPKYTYALLLRCTILGSPEGRLTQREIFADIKAKFPYYRTANAATWQGSMRHQLSLNRLFELEERPPTLGPGQGGYWRVNLNAPPGTKRPRKRGTQDNRSAAPPLTYGAPAVRMDDRQPGPSHHLAPVNYHWGGQGVLDPALRGQGYAGHYVAGGSHPGNAFASQWSSTRRYDDHPSPHGGDVHLHEQDPNTYS
ncbi:unnamed protein product [Peniophora sp. CBMAI 1063]|nr:unnamed protein product [Peniophora sp. CBMAI 1063]